MKDRTLVLLQIASLVNAVLGIATEDVRCVAVLGEYLLNAY